MTKNWKKITAEKKLNFFGSKTTIYLALGLHKERLSYRRSLQLSKEAIQHFKNELLNFYSTSVGHFCPPGSGSRFRIRIRIHWPDWIRIHSGSGSATLLATVFRFSPLSFTHTLIHPGLAKLGSGLRGTLRGYLYARNEQLARGFVAYADGVLLHRPTSSDRLCITKSYFDVAHLVPNFCVEVW